MKQFIIILSACLFLLVNSQVLAEDISEAEIFSGQLILSKDGTGFVKFKPCEACNSILINITSATKTYLNGVEVGLLKAREQTRPGFIRLQYSPNDQAARTIGFLK